jgi:hypothetical protein
MAEARKIRILSVLIGILIGSVLAYIYQMTLWRYEIGFVYQITPFYLSVWNLVALITIPALAGFISGLIDPVMAMQNGLYIGLISGVVNEIMASIRLLLLPTIPEVTVLYAFSFFAIMSIFLWMFIASVAGLLAKRY